TPWRDALMTGDGPPDCATSAFLFIRKTPEGFRRCLCASRTTSPARLPRALHQPATPLVQEGRERLPRVCNAGSKDHGGNDVRLPGCLPVERCPEPVEYGGRHFTAVTAHAADIRGQAVEVKGVTGLSHQCLRAFPVPEARVVLQTALFKLVQLLPVPRLHDSRAFFHH